MTEVQTVSRRNIAFLALLLTSVSAALEPAYARDRSARGPDYRSIAELEQALAEGRETVRSLDAATRVRITALDDSGPALNAVLDLVPAPAQALPPGALHGIPVLLKANIDTADGLPTHAGSLALLQHQATEDAPLAAALRAAGANLIGKANLSEWANFRSSRSSSGWSSIGGQTRNPHALDRSPCGSSSGSAVAVAAGMVPAAIGTETNGSIVCPAGINGVVGFKPSIGRVDMTGVIPIASAQDIAGPFARSVADAARVAAVMMTDAPTIADDLAGARASGLDGRRVGVWRKQNGGISDPRIVAVLEGAVAALGSGGATAVDPVGYEWDPAIGEASYQVLLKQFAEELPAYLNRVSDPARGQPRTLRALIDFNNRNAASTMPWFGQELLHETLAADRRMTAEDLATALLEGRDRLRSELTTLFDEQRLDALLTVTNGPAWLIDPVLGDTFSVGSSSLAAISGWPTITLPAGSVHGLPIGVSLVTRHNTDEQLMRLAAALEARLPAAPKPSFRSTVTR
ncbi:MAG: amidase family protein [Pseudomonadota bacterium]